MAIAGVSAARTRLLRRQGWPAHLLDPAFVALHRHLVGRERNLRRAPCHSPRAHVELGTVPWARDSGSLQGAFTQRTLRMSAFGLAYNRPAMLKTATSPLAMPILAALLVRRIRLRSSQRHPLGLRQHVLWFCATALRPYPGQRLTYAVRVGSSRCGPIIFCSAESSIDHGLGQEIVHLHHLAHARA